MSSTCVLISEHSDWHAMATPTATARSARERVREEMTAEILAVAREHVAQEGAAALSLRSVARDLELAPSALYRYFNGRDALLSALIMAAYESLATEAERAADQRAAKRRRGRRALACRCRGHAAVGLGTSLTSGASSSARRCRATRRPGTRSSRTPAWPRHWCAPWSKPRRPAASAAAGTEPPVADALREAVAPVAEGLFPDMPVDKVVQARPGVDDRGRRHQSRGVRALARHHPRPRGVLRGHDPRHRRGPSVSPEQRAHAAADAGDGRVSATGPAVPRPCPATAPDGARAPSRTTPRPLRRGGRPDRAARRSPPAA